MWCCIGCNDSTVADIDIEQGYEYFPLAIGLSWEYQVDSITYDPDIGGTRVDSSTSFLREVIIDTLPNTAAETTYIIERSTRSNPNQPWQVLNTWTASRTDNLAVRTEDNLRIIKLTFPIREDSRWDPTLFIDPTLEIIVEGETIEAFKNWDGRVLATNQMQSLFGTDYESVLFSQLADDENLIERRLITEQYAPNVGLIFREVQLLDTQCQVCCNSDFAGCELLAWSEKAEKGLFVRQQLIDFK